MSEYRVRARGEVPRDVGKRLAEAQARTIRGTPPAPAEEPAGDEGLTHFVGDGCTGGHEDDQEGEDGKEADLGSASGA